MDGWGLELQTFLRDFGKFLLLKLVETCKHDNFRIIILKIINFQNPGD